MFDTVGQLTSEWLNTADRCDRLTLEKELMGVITVQHPLATLGASYWYTVQLQQADRLMSLYFAVDRKLIDYEDVKSMLLDTGIAYMLEACWYVCNYWEITIDG